MRKRLGVNALCTFGNHDHQIVCIMESSRPMDGCREEAFIDEYIADFQFSEAIAEFVDLETAYAASDDGILRMRMPDCDQ